MKGTATRERGALSHYGVVLTTHLLDMAQGVSRWEKPLWKPTSRASRALELTRRNGRRSVVGGRRTCAATAGSIVTAADQREMALMPNEKVRAT